MGPAQVTEPSGILQVWTEHSLPTQMAFINGWALCLLSDSRSHSSALSLDHITSHSTNSSRAHYGLYDELELLSCFF